MSRSWPALAVLALCASLPGCAGRPVAAPRSPIPDAHPATSIDRLLETDALDGALLAVHVIDLTDGRVVYSRHANQRVIPASSLKLVTAAVAAERLGWDYRFETRLEASGPIEHGVLRGDLVVVGTGDPTIEARDLRTAPLFDTWADALAEAGVRTVDGRLIGDDNAFDDDTIGAGWAWDYLAAPYAPAVGALNYNENLVAIRVLPPTVSGTDTARVEVLPAGHGLDVDARVAVVDSGSAASVSTARLPGSAQLVVTGSLPADRASLTTATTVANPTQFFVEGLRLALASRGIHVSEGAHDIDAIQDAPREGRVIARHSSPPLRAVVARMLKSSPNLYGEVLFKAIGANAGSAGATNAAARETVAATLAAWGIQPGDSLVMYDGSGLSRYNYVTASLLVDVLERMWHDERHRAPFVAALPVGGHDGTLTQRMTGSLRRRVQAKTGTINNVRALAGYLDGAGGRRFAFAMIANHFVAPAARIDAAMEAVLERLAGADP